MILGGGEKIALAHAALPEHQTLESMMQGPCALAGTCYWELFRNTWLAWRQVQCIAAPGQAGVPDGHPISFFIYFARSLKQASLHPASFVMLLWTFALVCVDLKRWVCDHETATKITPHNISTAFREHGENSYRLFTWTGVGKNPSKKKKTSMSKYLKRQV